MYIYDPARLLVVVMLLAEDLPSRILESDIRLSHLFDRGNLLRHDHL